MRRVTPYGTGTGHMSAVHPPHPTTDSPSGQMAPHETRTAVPGPTRSHYAVTVATERRRMVTLRVSDLSSSFVSRNKCKMHA